MPAYTFGDPNLREKELTDAMATFRKAMPSLLADAGLEEFTDAFGALLTIWEISAMNLNTIAAALIPRGGLE